MSSSNVLEETATSHATTSSQPQMTLLSRCTAAGGASVVSALVVNPLDVVKTRLQAQATGTPLPSVPSLAKQQSIRAWEVAGCQEACQRLAMAGPSNSIAWQSRMPPMPSTLPPSCSTHCYVYDSAFDALAKILRQEGAGALWRGTGVSLLMAVPSVGIYLPLYDWLYASWRQQSGEVLAPYTPLAAGTVARAVTVVATNPLELLRTRLQAGSTQSTSLSALTQPAPQSNAALQNLRGGLRGNLRGFTGAWKGLRATLARDVPFSAIYWGTVEPIRQAMLVAANDGITWSTHEVPCNNTTDCCAMDGKSELHIQRHNVVPVPPQNGPSMQQVLAANVVAGSTAGALAAAVTTPLDVIKTQVQLSAGSDRQPLWQSLKHLMRKKGPRGLFAGVGARAARTAPACAIVLSSYELLKHYHQQ